MIRRSMLLRLIAVALFGPLLMGACGDDTTDVVLGGAEVGADGSDDDSDGSDESDDSDDSDDSDESDESDDSDEESDDDSDESDEDSDEESDFTDFSDDSACATDEGGCAQISVTDYDTLQPGTPAPGPIDEYDELWTDCDDGDDGACDELYFVTIDAIGTVYEAWGITCGGRFPENTGGTCAEPIDDFSDDFSDLSDDVFSDDFFFGSCDGSVEGGCAEFDDNYTAFDPTTPAPGPVAEWDELWTECGAGDLVACDDLWISTPIGGVYEAYAASCGGRFDDGNNASNCVSTG